MGIGSGATFMSPLESSHFDATTQALSEGAADREVAGDAAGPRRFAMRRSANSVR